MQPVGSTLTTASRRTASRMNWIVPALSAGGVVLGMQTTVVNPPAAAALEPVADRLLVRLAGLAEVDVDVDEPGRQATRPLASILLAFASSRRRERPTIRPSSGRKGRPPRRALRRGR
jgi:hypothetical protein